MSFSDQVRQEMLEEKLLPAEIWEAMAYGCLLFFYDWQENVAVQETRSQAKAEGLCRIFREGFGVTAEMQTKKKGKSDLFVVRCPEPQKLLAPFGCHEERPSYINHKAIKGVEKRAAFLAGVFFVSGSVNAPEQAFHLEFTPPTEQLAEELQSLAQKADLPLRRSVRKGKELVYTKVCDTIEGFLTLFGAPHAALLMMESQIEKAVKNQINRRNNCDTANIGKTMDASMKQLDAIRKLMDSETLYDLPEELQQVALLRMANPELSLSELGKLMMPPLSRSGVYHRLEKLAKKAHEGEI